MTIDRSGEWPVGTEAADLADFLLERMAPTTPPDRVVHVRCRGCGCREFELYTDEDQGYALHVCMNDDCPDDSHAIIDEEAKEHAEDECSCPCGGGVFELAVGFSHVDVQFRDGTVRPRVKYVLVAGRCVVCGILGLYVDWTVRESPTDDYYDRV